MAEWQNDRMTEKYPLTKETFKKGKDKKG